MQLIIDIPDSEYKNIKDYPNKYPHKVKVLGGRHNGKMRELIIEAYKKGWNDCIDTIRKEVQDDIRKSDTNN